MTLYFKITCHKKTLLNTHSFAMFLILFSQPVFCFIWRATSALILLFIIRMNTTFFRPGDDYYPTGSFSEIFIFYSDICFDNDIKQHRLLFQNQTMYLHIFES